jgi:hypothetical protein
MLECKDTAIIEHVYNWTTYVATTKTSNNFAVCPHANHVFKHRRLQVYWYDGKTVDQIVAAFRRYKDNFKVWALVCRTQDPVTECEWLNKHYDDLIWLYDLADDTGHIGDTPTGNRKHNMILLQDKKELNRLSEKLQKAGYYSNWSQAYYDQVVAWRFK